MENKQQIDQQTQSLNDTLERAGAFEQMVGTKGWEWLMANYQTRVQVFTTNVLTSDQPIETYENERQQIIGVKNLIGDVQSDLETLSRYRKEKENEQQAQPAPTE